LFLSRGKRSITGKMKQFVREGKKISFSAKKKVKYSEKEGEGRRGNKNGKQAREARGPRLQALFPPRENKTRRLKSY